MGFEMLLGNERLKENLTAALAKDRISHFYLISGPAGSGKHTLARLLAAAVLCRGHHKPCLRCEPCRKVMENCHPDFITVEDPEHKNVAVKIVRQFRDDVFIRPNESEHKIYLFPQELGIEGQNALLKILEEPPAYGVFMLLTDNPEKLLPTVRSRCVELELKPLPQPLLQQTLEKEFPEADDQTLDAAMQRSGGFLGQARKLLSEGGAVLPQTEAFVQSFLARDSLELTKLLVSMEKWKREQFIAAMEQWQQFLGGALACKSGVTAVSPLMRKLSDGRSARELMAALEAVRKATEYAQRNVSCGAICGWLVWQLR